MKNTLLTLLVVGLIAGAGYYFLTQGPAREDLVFAGNYQSFESAQDTIDSDIITVLNFYAPRCPSCRTAHSNLLSQANQLPANLQILNVDYDTHKDLRTQYGVTSQHTFVLIDRNGNKLKSIQGLNHVSEIISFVGSDILNPIVPTIATEDIQIGDTQTEDIQTGDSQINLTTQSETTIPTTPGDINTDKPSQITPIEEKPQQEEKSVGIYTDYESGKKYISDPSKKVVLFFHASRCPSCKQAEQNILANKDSIDSDLVILKVDYDTATDLRKQYGITSQTSYVLVNSDGSLNKKSIGLTSLSAIEAFVQ